MYQCVLFDLDGTLADSSQGIIHGYQYAFRKLAKKFPGNSLVQKAIGAPLPFALEKILGIRKEEIPSAIQFYRAYYQKTGKKEVRLYPGIEKCLNKLKSSELFLAVATLKREDFAIEILKELKIAHYFDFICGMDEKDRLTKKDLIWMCLDRFGCSFQEAVLVGDSSYDAKGAALAGIAFLPVTYGFGYHTPKGLPIPPFLGWAESPDQIADLILQEQSLSP